MLKKLRPSPALVVACLALLLSLGGTAVAAGVVPLAKRALFANNAGKLQGRTAAQVAAQPGPASTAAGLVATRTGSFSLGTNSDRGFTVSCSAGEKAIAGGFDTQGTVLAADTRPSDDGASWQIYLVNIGSSSASGTLYAVCLR